MAVISDLIRRITKKTKVIYLIHDLGFSKPVAAINKIYEQHMVFI